MKVLLTYDYGDEAIKKMRTLGYDVILKKEKGLTYTEELKDVEVLVCYDPFDTLDISQMKSLKWIQLSSIGIDQLPKEKLKNRDIIVTNNQGGYSKPMGEWIVLSILEILKNKKAIYKNQEKKKWKMYKNLLELVDKKVLFLGTGTIASEGAKRLQGFECVVHGVNTSGHDADYFDEVFPTDKVNEIISDYDVVVSTLPKIEATYHFIDQPLMDLMKDDVILVNVSRGEIIDEEALIEALNKGKFLGVNLDVFTNEPLDETSKLWDFERVYISSHNSWISEKRNERRINTILENMERYSENQPLINQKKVTKGY
jgi:phosphoglycerate dehydrogenase-like enzyme